MVSIIFLGLNDIGERIYDWLIDRDDANVVALVTELDQLTLVERLQPDLLISAGFRHIVPEEILDVPEYGAVNMHKSYLPHNRGANPNVWSIIEDGPAGVSIHYMTSDIDGGEIIDRRKVPIFPDDDGRSLYERLETAQFEQFSEVWPAIRDGAADTVEQDQEVGSYHAKEEFVDMWEIDRDSQMNLGDFIDQLRALTFDPFKNSYFEVNGQQYWVELSITPKNNTDQEDGSTSTKNIPRYSSDGNN